MASLQSHIDLECGLVEEENEEEEASVCFSDADEGSCNSQFYSTADGEGSYDDYSSFACGSEILEDDSPVVADNGDDDFVDVESGEKKGVDLLSSRVERDCRICHLSLVSSSPGAGVAMELGCSCKDDLAAAHKHCAETWFKIKGNKTCEICNSIARNVVGPNDTESAQQGGEISTASTVTAPSVIVPSAMETRSCLNGHRLLNFLLACMVFAFVISWLFHFNIPS